MEGKSHWDGAQVAVKPAQVSEEAAYCVPTITDLKGSQHRQLQHVWDLSHYIK